MERADDVSSGAGVSQIEQRVVTVVEFTQQRVRRAVSQSDDIAAKWQAGSRGIVADDRQFHAGEFLRRAGNLLGEFVVTSRSGHDNGHPRLAGLDQVRLQVKLLQFRNRRHVGRLRNGGKGEHRKNGDRQPNNVSHFSSHRFIPR